MHRAAMTPQRRPDRADASAARALLLPELAACAAHFALFLHFVRAAAKSSEIPARRFVQKVFVYLRGEDRVGKLNLPDFLAIQIYDIYDRHFFFPSLKIVLTETLTSPSLQLFAPGG